jgi:Chaperone of endosialidase
MTCPGTWLVCLPFGMGLLAPSASGQEATSDLAHVQAVAEAIVAREEVLSERAFDPAFRAKAKELLATLPLAELVAPTAEDGLGLNSLGDNQADLVYTPLTPCRILDTRIAGGAIPAGTTRSFLVTGTDYSAQGGKATGCGVPFGPTTAVVANFAAAKPAGPGNVRVTPYGQAIPLAAILNFTGGVTLANGLAVATCNPASATCTSDITIQIDVNATDLVADVQGYFQRVATGGVGTALLADSAVTAPKISSGVVVRSLNAQTDAVTLAGANGLSVSQGSGTVTVTSNATSTNAAGTIVARDGAGGFASAWIGLTANLFLPNTTSAGVGVLTKGGMPFLHTFGLGSTFVGAGAGNFTLTGEGNSAFGFGALQADTAGHSNSAFGHSALQANTTGYHNSAFGYRALQANTTGYHNIAFGNSLGDNTTGNENSAFGFAALRYNTTGNSNSAFGSWALSSNTTGWPNAAFGNHALSANTTGGGNAAFGYGALLANTTAGGNSAFGHRALSANTTGGGNAAFGYGALDTNTTGYENSGFGHWALTASTGAYNSAVGTNALSGLSTGDRNTAIGYNAGYLLTSGNDNVYLNNDGVASESNTMRLGGIHISNTHIAGIYENSSAAGVAVLVNSSGKLGTTTSSRRYKEQIVDMEAESDVLLKLRPVSFFYRPELDETHLRQYGLVAEEAAEVAPDLVAYDKDGAPQAVRYHFVNAMLLNEVQKQRRLIEEQRRENEEQQAIIQALEARLAKLEAARGIH